MVRLQEHHGREQYFFDDETAGELADLAGSFERPCCLCAPTVGAELHRRGRIVRVLDIDRRFANLYGFMEWNVYRPRRLDEEFGVILCDPPFFNVSLSQLFSALRVLSHFDLARPVAVSYLKRRERAVLGTFALFGLRPTGYRPRYRTVEACDRNEIEFYANFPSALWPAWSASEEVTA